MARRSEASEADLEVVLRIASARAVMQAVLEGRLIPTPELLDALADLTGSAALWARRAAA